MKPFKHIIAGFAVCGFALTLSITSARAADPVEPTDYPWASEPAPVAAADNTASGQAAPSKPSHQKWVAHPIAGRTTKGIAAPRPKVTTKPGTTKAGSTKAGTTRTVKTKAGTTKAGATRRPGRPALSVARRTTPRKARSTSTAQNRRVAYHARSNAPGRLAQHKTAAAQPVGPQVGPSAPLTARSVVISQKNADGAGTQDEALPAPPEVPTDGVSTENVIIEEDVPFGAYPHPILSLLAPPWQQSGPWQEAACCVGDFCPLGKVLCALGQVADYSEYSFGVQAFKDPIDMGSNGNFGLHYGANWSGALLPWHGIGYQVGGNVLHSNFSGHNTGGVTSNDDRLSTYTTVGVFQRQMNTGLQGGVVWDWRHDEFYQHHDVHQVRGEISFKHQCADEFGIWFTVNTRDDLLTRVGDTSDSIISTSELYAFFYRKSWECGGEGRIYAGFSGESDGVIGGDIRLPVNDRWAIDAQATYLIPNEPNGLAGTTTESWGVGISMVWTPKYGSDGAKYPFRALLPVASPATMMGIFK